MFVLPLLFAASVSRGLVDPSLWLTPRGVISTAESVDVRMTPGVSTTMGPRGTTGWSFDGGSSSLGFADLKSLQHAKSLTIAAWVNMRSRPASAGQIVFRGDDRGGLDPFSLVVHSDGTVHFGITNARGLSEQVESTLPENQWVHVCANIDDRTGFLTLRINGEVAAQAKTTVRPDCPLDPHWSPGIGIGNVQNSNGGIHNQPFVGTLSDVRIYTRTVSPEAAGYYPVRHFRGSERFEG